MYNVYITLLFLENCVLLCYYAANSGNYLPTFWYNLSEQFSRVDNLKRNPAVLIWRLCGKTVAGDFIVTRIVGTAIFLDMYM
jgi:hypothetical protein